MIEIIKITHQLGSLKEENTDIEELVGWDAEEIFNKTGIRQRYISADDETSETLALEVAKKFGVDTLNSCDLIISVSNTQSNDFPTIAHYVHSNLGLDSSVKCLGLNAGCSGFVDALEIIYSYFASGFAKRAAIINSDTYSKFLFNDRSTRTLFSDGALITLLEKSEEGFIMTNKISSSAPLSYSHLIKQELNGIRQISMNGPKVLQFALTTVFKDLNNLIGDSVSTLLPHQAGKLVLDALKKKLSPNIQILTNYENYGNLVSASIPNLLRENFSILLEPRKIILSGFGVGLCHNAVVLERKN